MFVFHAAAFTHRGRVRTANEDGVAIDDRVLVGDMPAPTIMTIATDTCVLMVADGMGGHAHGATASRAVLDLLIADAERLASPETCADAIRTANDHLYELMEADPTVVSMGSTLVGAALASAQLLIFNVGDSRAYLHSSNYLMQLSSDDVPSVALDRSGSRISHAVTQAIGGSTFRVPIEPNISFEPPLLPGETLLLCSDGLTDMVSDSIIQDVLRRAADVGAAARGIAAHAFRAGAVDNISLVLAKRIA
jgi:serine/threonine protein phosphatase PrpC